MVTHPEDVVHEAAFLIWVLRVRCSIIHLPVCMSLHLQIMKMPGM